jgi:hypothetical protein
MREARNEGGPAARRGFAMKGMALFAATPKGAGTLNGDSALLSWLGRHRPGFVVRLNWQLMSPARTHECRVNRP